MLTAVILVKSARDALTDLGPKLADVPGVAEVYTVTGEWDFVAIVRVREHDELAEVVTQRLTKLDGIERTQTMDGRLPAVLGPRPGGHVRTGT